MVLLRTQFAHLSSALRAQSAHLNSAVACTVRTPNSALRVQSSHLNSAVKYENADVIRKKYFDLFCAPRLSMLFEQAVVEELWGQRQIWWEPLR